MMLRKRNIVYRPSDFQGVAVQGTTQQFDIPNVQPIEELLIIVNGTFTATATTRTNILDNLLNVLKRITLDINDGVTPRSQVSYSGPGLIEYCSQVGLNLDRSTLEAVRINNDTTVAMASQSFRVAYRVPIVHPMIAEPLRTRMLLPCHTWAQAPVLKLEFAPMAEIASAGALASLSTEVVVKHRVMPEKLTADILANGGFISSDLVEKPFSIGPGVSGEARFQISSPGSYLNLMFRQYLGGANLTRNVIDEVTTVGRETKWRIESGLVPQHEWTWKGVQIENDFSRVCNGLTQTSSPNFGGAIAANTQFQPAGSAILDFLSDGLDSANELGSVLDANIDARSGLKLEVVGAVQSVATNASVLYIGGHRLFGDLSRWQALKAA